MYEVTDKVMYGIYDQIDSQIEGRIEDQVGRRIEGHTEKQIWMQAWTWLPIWEMMRGQIKEQMKGRAKDLIDE